MRKAHDGPASPLNNSSNFSATANNCSSNSQCSSLCCQNFTCASANFCNKPAASLNHVQILCVMGFVIALLIAIVLYIRSISKKHSIKSSGPYLGKHTYLSRKTYLVQERLIQPHQIKMKSKPSSKLGSLQKSAQGNTNTTSHA